MPFTLAHPIAILPLWWGTQKRLDLPALAVGAAIPDISYFIALETVGNIGHRFSGVFLQGLPSAFALLLIGRYLLWRPVLALCPQAIAARIPFNCPYSFGALPRLLNIAVSVVVGALSHIIWDSFTHGDGWSVRRISWLTSAVGPLPIYKWLQYSGGVIGFSILLLLLGALIARRPLRYHNKTLPLFAKAIAWGSIAAIALLTIWTAITLHLSANSSFSAVVVRAIIGSVSGLFIGLCAYASILWLTPELRNKYLLS